MSLMRVRDASISGSTRLFSYIAPEEAMATGNSAKKIMIEGLFDGEILNNENDLVAIRLNDSNIQAYSASAAKEEVASAGSASKQKDRKEDDMTGKTVFFNMNDGMQRKGLIVCQRPPIAFVLVQDPIRKDFDPSDVSSISVSDQKMTIKVSDNFKGKVIDCFGNIMQDIGKSSSDNDDLVDKQYDRAIFASIPQVKDIALINKPLLTGISMIDALAPIGLGQNMLIVGQKSTGKRNIALDAIANQVRFGDDGALCIYACTSTDEATRKELLQKIEKAGLSEKIVVVGMREVGDTTKSSNENPDEAAEAVAICGSACALAEAWALNEGKNSFVVIDDLSYHKVLWTHSTQTLVNTWGMDAVVNDDRGASSEMRAYYSALIQRSAQYNTKNGGGSVTLALINELPGSKYEEASTEDSDDEIIFDIKDFNDSTPKIKERIEQLIKANISITPAILKKIQIPIPTTRSSEEEKLRQMALIHTDDLISMSDGQIWLSEDKYMNGQRPALDPQQSITRVGIGADTVSAADAKAIRKLAKGLRFEFNQANSLIGAVHDEATRKQLRRFNAWLLSFHQNSGVIRDLSEECITMCAAGIGALDDLVGDGCVAGSEDGVACIENLISSIKASIPEVLAEINTTQDLTDENERKLYDSISTYFKNYSK